MTQIVEGYMFWSSGCEHGPSIIVTQDWDSELYEHLDSDSWCDNAFLYRANEDEDGDVFEELNVDLTPGQKYRITIEEI